MDERTLKILIKSVVEIEKILEDSNQNLKDCKSLLKEIKKDLFPKPDGILKKLLRILKYK